MTQDYITLTRTTIKTDYDKALQAFNNELNEYFEQSVANERPYFGDGAMLSWLGELEGALNEGANLAWELGKKTRTGYVATFEPSEGWQETYLQIDHERLEQ